MFVQVEKHEACVENIRLMRKIMAKGKTGDGRSMMTLLVVLYN